MEAGFAKYILKPLMLLLPSRKRSIALEKRRVERLLIDNGIDRTTSKMLVGEIFAPGHEK
jgi:hypothetical protein